MRIKRLLVGALGAALLGATPVALAAAPASAAPSHGSHISLNSQAYSTYRYGQTIKIRGYVYVDGLGECADPASTYCRPPDTAGVVRLERQFAGSSTWAVVATQSNEAVDFSFATIAKRNTTFRVTYTGGSVPDHAFTPSSVSRAIKVSRNPGAKVVKSAGKLYFKGNVDPGWARRYVTIQRKTCKSCGWRTYQRVITNRYGAYQARIAAPRTGYWYWRAFVPATSPTFAAGYSSVWRTYQS